MKLKLLNYNKIVQLKNFPAMSKKCMICKEPIFGRIDKQFCSDNCRNRYHNSLKSIESMYLRRVNYILRRNRRILLESFHKGQDVVFYQHLLNKGFNYSYITNYQINESGCTSYYCYDIGYTYHSNLEIRLLKRDIESNTIN
jgi:hypothetical protein